MELKSKSFFFSFFSDLHFYNRFLKCFHVRVYKNRLNKSFVIKLKTLLSGIRKILHVTNRRIHIFLLLSGKKKSINVGQIFTTENINSGVSISTSDLNAVHSNITTSFVFLHRRRLTRI
jgi:hypothetical protein